MWYSDSTSPMARAIEERYAEIEANFRRRQSDIGAEYEAQLAAWNKHVAEREIEDAARRAAEAELEEPRPAAAQPGYGQWNYDDPLGADEQRAPARPGWQPPPVPPVADPWPAEPPRAQPAPRPVRPARRADDDDDLSEESWLS